MQANIRRKFKAPRLLKGKETARESDSDEDNIPFSELNEKVRAERQGVDCEEGYIPCSQGQTKDATPSKSRNTRMLKVNMVGKKVSKSLLWSMKLRMKTRWSQFML
jgi:hypothetical protein